jgi:hypothetical protein
MKKILVSATAALLVSTSAFAAGNTNTGCGLGSMLIKDQSSLLMQLVASSLNGTSGNQTFGITLGTLGCEKPAKIASNLKLEKFVGENMDNIAMDIANGQGESLNTLATLMNVKDAAAFSAKLQNNFEAIYTADNVSSANVIDNIITIAG